MAFGRILLFTAVLLLTFPDYAASQEEKQKPPISIGGHIVGQAARAHFDQGMTLLNKRDLDGAIAAFTKAAETDPEFADAIISRGMARWFKQDLEGAVADYGKAIEIDPNNPQAYFRRALALAQTQPERAIADYAKVIELDPKSIGAYINRSMLLKNRGDFRGAKADLDAAILLEPYNPGVYNNRGILHWETGNGRDALADLDRSIELQSNVAGMYLIRGFIKASLREFQAAYKDIDQAFQLDPNLRNGRIADPEIVDHYTERGRQLTDSGDFDGALVDFNKAVILGGPVGQFPASQVGSRRKSLAAALGNRGLIWLRKGNETEAQKDLAECLRFDPGKRSWLEDQIRSSGLKFPLNSIPPYQDERRPTAAVAVAPAPITAFTPAETAATRPTPTFTLPPVQTGNDSAAQQNMQESSADVEALHKAAEQGYAQAQYNLGVTYAQGRGVAQDFAEAAKWYRKAAEQGDFRAQNNLGTAYLRGRGVAQDYAEALKWYRKAAEQGDGLAQLNVGRIYVRGEGVTPDYVQAFFWLNLSVAALEKGTQQQAEAVKQLAAVARRMTPQQMAEAESFGKEWSARTNQIWPINFVPGKGELTAEELHENGFEYGALGKFDAAKEEFEKALKILSNNPSLKIHLRVIEYVNQQKIAANMAISYFKAIAYFSGKQRDQAIAECNKALEINPEFVEAYITRGNVYFAQGQYDAALSDFNEAIKRYPADPFLYVLRGNAHDMKNLTDNAMADYNKAIEVDPKCSLAYAKRGYIHHVRKREYDAAISEYNKAIDLYSEDPSFYTLRGAAYKLKGQMEKSASDLKKAEELSAKRAGTSNSGLKTDGGDGQGNRTIPVTIQETLPQPILSTLEQMGNVSPFVLGKGYLALESMIGILDLVAKRSNVKLILILNGERVTVTQENAPQVLQDFREKLRVYRQAIEQRGYSKVDGYYEVNVNKAIEGKDYFDVVTLFSDSELSQQHEYILAQERQIKQQDFNAQLTGTMGIGGAKKGVSFSGLVIGDSIIFSVPNTKWFFYGTLNNNTIELRIDLNELNRSQSFEAAVQAFADPKKAAVSDLNKVNYSDWIITLKRRSSNQSMELKSSDQLLIATPDKKLRQVIRQEIH